MKSLLSWATGYLTEIKFLAGQEISLDNFFLVKFDVPRPIGLGSGKFPLVIFDHEKEDFTTEIAVEYDRVVGKISKIIQLAIRPKSGRSRVVFNSLRHDSIATIQTVDGTLVMQEWGSAGILDRMVVESDSVYVEYEYVAEIECLVRQETQNSYTLPKSIGSAETEFMGVPILRSINARETALQILISAKLDRIITALNKKGFIQIDSI